MYTISETTIFGYIVQISLQFWYKVTLFSPFCLGYEPIFTVYGMMNIKYVCERALLVLPSFIGLQISSKFDVQLVLSSAHGWRLRTSIIYILISNLDQDHFTLSGYHPFFKLCITNHFEGV